MSFRLSWFSLFVATLLVLDGSTQPASADERMDVDPARPGRLILHYCKADGAPLRPLVQDKMLRDRLDRQGTPDMSADGRQVAFDAWSRRGSWQDAKVVIVDVDGNNAKEVCYGVMPSFSSDGKKLAVSRPPKHAKHDGAQGMSIWVVDIESGKKELIADQGAWGARWSPDGRSLAFIQGRDTNNRPVPSSCVRLYDFETGEISNVFEPSESPFSNIVFHLDWTKAEGDGRQIAFGGQLKKGGSATAVIDVDKGIESLRLLQPSIAGQRISDGASVDWRPGGDGVLVTGFIDGRFFPVLLPTKPSAPIVGFEGIPENVMVRDPMYTVDSEHLIAAFSPWRVPKPKVQEFDFGE